MATKTGFVHTFRVDQDTKRAAENIFADLGYPTAEAIRMFLAAVVYHKGLPFEVAYPKKSPPPGD